MLQPFDLNSEGRGTDFWVKRLTRQSMPVVGQVIARLNTLSEDDEADINELAELILRDPNMTSHVLRIANSVQYNVSRKRINTVSRAIVMIGLKGMRALCISLMLIDTLLEAGPKERMVEVMAQSFHAAAQARALMSGFGEDASEEAFIAALLLNLGEMAFWSTVTKPQKYRRMLVGTEEARKQATQDVLGTDFKKISGGLARQWKLGQTLEEALKPKRSSSRQAQAVVLGEKISLASLKGWNSPEMGALIKEACDLTGKDAKYCFAQMKEQAEVALEVAKQYGAEEACAHIPSKTQTYVAPAPSVKKSRIMKSDPQLQLNILRELTNTVAQKQNVNTIFQMVVEGIHRGIGMERVAVGFIKDYRVNAKHSLGYGTESWRDNFDFDVGPYSDNFFGLAVEKGGLIWVDARFLKSHKTIRTDSTGRVLGNVDCLVFVLEVAAKKPGLIYADRGGFGGLITQNHADSFHHFASQAQYNLQALTPVRGK